MCVLRLIGVLFAETRAKSNGIAIEVSRHHTVSVSHFRSIKVSNDDCIFNVIPGFRPGANS